MPSKSVVPNPGPPDVLGLQLLEILASKGGGEGFWELYSKNIWRPKVGDHCSKAIWTYFMKKEGWSTHSISFSWDDSSSSSYNLNFLHTLIIHSCGAWIMQGSWSSVAKWFWYPAHHSLVLRSITILHFQFWGLQFWFSLPQHSSWEDFTNLIRQNIATSAPVFQSSKPRYFEDVSETSQLPAHMKGG